MEVLIKKIKIIIVMIVFSISFQSFPIYANDNSSEETVRLSGEYIIVLDSGHDLEHVGARGNGIKEEEINLIITRYCKEALEKYENITVYLTHEDLKCPFSGTDAKECNKKRCEFAASVNADLFISIHANSSPDRSRNGFEIIYPNTHYKAEFNETGKALSNFIVEELAKTGLRFREIWTRNSDENKKNDENFYPDGTRADYYNIIRNTKYNDILGIIIEHGYVSNKNDARTYLSSDEDLKCLGEADAAGIINYLISIDEPEDNAEVKVLIRNKIKKAKDFITAFKNLF